MIQNRFQREIFLFPMKIINVVVVVDIFKIVAVIWNSNFLYRVAHNGWYFSDDYREFYIRALTHLKTKAFLIIKPLSKGHYKTALKEGGSPEFLK